MGGEMMEFEGKEGWFAGKLGWWRGGGYMNGEMLDYAFYFFRVACMQNMAVKVVHVLYSECRCAPCCQCYS